MDDRTLLHGNGKDGGAGAEIVGDLGGKEDVFVDRLLDISVGMDQPVGILHDGKAFGLGDRLFQLDHVK